MGRRLIFRVKKQAAFENGAETMPLRGKRRLITSRKHAGTALSTFNPSAVIPERFPDMPRRRSNVCRKDISGRRISDRLPSRSISLNTKGPSPCIRFQNTKTGTAHLTMRLMFIVKYRWEAGKSRLRIQVLIVQSTFPAGP